MNLVGKTFRQLTVLGFAEYRKNLKYWRCQCTCGRTTVVFQGSLTRKKGFVRSCGCLVVKTSGELNRLSLGQSAKNRRIAAYQITAKRKNLVFDLTDEQFFTLTQSPCHYCGIEPYRSSNTLGTHHYGDFVYNGIDRKDSLQGYNRENCVPCCRLCNMGKLDVPYEEFIQHLIQIARFRCSAL